MSTTLFLAEKIHARAREVSKRYKRVEAELIDVIQQVEIHRVFTFRKYGSLFQYVVQELRLGENIAYTMITIARKARLVPELKACLERGDMTLSNARRVVSVLDEDNRPDWADWIHKACKLTSHQLDREIVRVKPQAATPDSATFITPDWVQIGAGMSQDEVLALRRAQDLLSQSRRKPATFGETIAVLTREYLRRHDPIEKAKRHRVKNPVPFVKETTHPSSENTSAAANDSTRVPSEHATDAHNSRDPKNTLVTRRDLIPQPASKSPHLLHPVRERIPAYLMHQVNLRDQGRCTHILPNGVRCNQSRWTETHHIVPVKFGGPNTLVNLTTLCSAHHRLVHTGQVPTN